MNRRLLYLTGLIAVLLCARALAHSQDGHSPTVGRSVVATEFGIVAASQPLAARAGVEMLERGGNAIDAAIAANPTSAVRHDFHLIWPIWSTNRVCFLCLDLLGGRVVPTYPLD